MNDCAAKGCKRPINQIRDDTIVLRSAGLYPESEYYHKSCYIEVILKEFQVSSS